VEVLFDFADDAPKAFERQTEADEPDLLGFAKRVGADITERLAKAVETLSDPNSITHIVIIGYYNGRPEYVQVKFTVSTAPDKSKATVCDGCTWPLDRDMPTGCGSTIILERLRSREDDPLFAKYRPSASAGQTGIRRAVEIAKNAVDAHFDKAIRALDPEICAAIGGHTEVAQITPAGGFSWVEGHARIDAE
jgi:hypothetical protein